MQMEEVQSTTGQDDSSENNGLGKMGKHTDREAQKGHLCYGYLRHHSTR